jgi:hypothetical protein
MCIVMDLARKPFDVYHDVSGTGIRGLLVPDGHVIAYAS